MKIREGISMNLATELSGIETSQVQNNRSILKKNILWNGTGEAQGTMDSSTACNWACVVSETIKERRKHVIKIEPWMSYWVVQSSCCRQWFKISFKECWYWRMLVILNRRKKKTWNWSGPYGTFLEIGL